MTAPTIAPPEAQPATFAFTEENHGKAKAVIAKYPPGRQQSAVIPLLDLAQRQHQNWLPQAAVRHVAELLDMPYIRAWEVATFYTMFNLAPVGRHLVQVCTTTPCWLRGSEAIVAACEKHLGVGLGGTTADGAFTLKEAECQGACVNAPMLQLGDGYYEDLTPENVVALLEAVAAGKAPPPGSLTGRQTSCPSGGLTSLVSSEVNYGEPASGDAAE
ncbi:MAG: NADH-quinone oxidoreductase subunit NuoE [Sneathiellaceae bacterium]